MANTAIDKNKLIDRASDAFRRRGYEATSFSHLVQATGLQRATLFHHFPGGKEEIARAVMQRADERFTQYILEPLSESGDARKRTVRIGERLAEFYERGEKACLLNAFSFEECTPQLRQHVNNSFDALLAAFARLAEESGFPAPEAARRAEDAMIRVQGALVFARAGKNNNPFSRVIRELPELLVK